jgi:hypothetical protein
VLSDEKICEKIADNYDLNKIKKNRKKYFCQIHKDTEIIRLMKGNINFFDVTSFSMYNFVVYFDYIDNQKKERMTINLVTSCGKILRYPN